MRNLILLSALLLTFSACSNEHEGTRDNASTESNKPAPVAISNSVDPVCSMPITAADANGHADYQGKTLGFCSEECAEEFKKNPAQYASAIK